MKYEPGGYPPERAPEAIAFDEWLRTPEGYSCADGRAGGEYLQNRLWFAFMAGYSARTSGAKHE